MAEHPLDDLDVGAGGHGQARGGVSEVVDPQGAQTQIPLGPLEYAAAEALSLGRIIGGRMGCRKVVHKWSGSARRPFGFVVLGPPLVALEDLGEYGGVVAGRKAILATVRPRDIAGKTRRRMAAEELADLATVDAKLKKIKAELKAMVLARGSTLLQIHGIGPAGAARTLADVGDITRFADRNRFASWTGTAPLDASSGEQIRHRLSRAGNRRMNHVLHIAAIVQLRNDTEGRAYRNDEVGSATSSWAVPS